VEAERVEEGFAGEMAGDFAGGCSAHAIADDEGANAGQGGAGVLVDVADAAAMREHGERAGERRWGCDHSGGGVRLRGFQSRSVCHLSTRDRGIWGTLKQYSTWRWGLNGFAVRGSLGGTTGGSGLNRIVHGDNLDALRRMEAGSAA
jgi:hypothetical protein